MLKSRTVLSLLTIACLFAVAPLSALNIATVRMERAYTAFHKQETMRAGFLAEREKAQAEAQRRQQQFQARVERLQDMGERLENGMLSAEAREALEMEAQAFLEQLQREEQELIDWRDALIQNLSERESAARAEILEEIRNVIVAMARESGFDLVLDSSDPLETGVPPVFFAQPALDITERVIARLNAGASSSR